MKSNHNIFIISRTDSIGDVILTLPMTGILKQKYPDCYIYFLGQKYTQPIIECAEYVDAFLDWTEIKKLPFKEQLQLFKRLSADEIIHVYPVKEIAKLSKAAKIPIRTGTQNRLYHWIYCNKLVKLSRRNSDLHEAQLNIKLLSDIQADNISLNEISSFYGLKVTQPLSKDLQKYIIPHKINLILHPKSKGSAREWGLENYANLIASLPKEKYNILVTGTEEEGLLYRKTLVFPYPYVHDLSGKLSLQELICLINAADVLVACSTGTLHIAASLNKLTIGIYPPVRPMHPGRWSPIGKNAHVLVLDKECNICRKTLDCQCIRSITPKQVIELLSLLYSTEK